MSTIIPGRTLAIKGSKKVEAVVQSISSLTHSYTIMAGVTMDFKLLPLYILFKEHTKDGDWPPTLKENIIANMVFFNKIMGFGHFSHGIFMRTLENRI